MAGFEIFRVEDLSEKQFEALYNTFLNAYKGEYFSKNSFLGKRWLFFGTKPSDLDEENKSLAFISYRMQRSGGIKVTGMASTNPLLLRNVAREFAQQFKNFPVWSSPTPDLVNMAKRFMDMYAPSEMPGGVELLKELVPKIPSYVFGGDSPAVTDEGSLRVRNPITLEEIDKVLIGNKAYLESILSNPLLRQAPSLDNFKRLNPELFGDGDVTASYLDNKLFKLAEYLENSGLNKEAAYLNSLINKFSSEEPSEKYWGSAKQPYWRPGPNYTVDLVVIYNNKVLLIQRSSKASAEPGKWAIPGGFIDTSSKPGEEFKFDKETPKDAALRELAEETGLELSSIPGVQQRLKQVGKFEGNGRDPRDNDEAWSCSYAFTITLSDEDNIDYGKIRGMDDAENAKWFDINELPSLAFDHNAIVSSALSIGNKLAFINSDLLSLAIHLSKLGLNKEAAYLNSLIKESAKKKKKKDKRTPTKPELWSRAKAKAKQKFDIWPSAYSVGFALREYKKMGGGWRGKKPIK